MHVQVNKGKKRVLGVPAYEDSLPTKKVPINKLNQIRISKAGCFLCNRPVLHAPTAIQFGPLVLLPLQDIPALRYVCRINGLTHINLTKLDVLSDQPNIKVWNEERVVILLNNRQAAAGLLLAVGEPGMRTLKACLSGHSMLLTTNMECNGDWVAAAEFQACVPLFRYSVQIGTQYRSKAGAAINSMPANLEVLEEVQAPVAKCPHATALPAFLACKAFCNFASAVLGRILTSIISTLQVDYETVPGWMCDISHVRTWEDLPQQAKDYVQRIEDLTGIYCRWIGVGPGRDAIVAQALSPSAGCVGASSRVMGVVVSTEACQQYKD
eukprot:1155222-Pelagomonas_calceolata.AAC.4